MSNSLDASRAKNEGTLDIVDQQAVGRALFVANAHKRAMGQKARAHAT